MIRIEKECVLKNVGGISRPSLGRLSTDASKSKREVPELVTKINYKHVSLKYNYNLYYNVRIKKLTRIELR